MFEVGEGGKAQLMDCAKWERNPEAVSAEQEAIENYTGEEIDFINTVIEREQPDEKPSHQE